jgi:hypothetical protein
MWFVIMYVSNFAVHSCMTAVHVQSIKASSKDPEYSIVCVYSDKLSGQCCVAL